MWLRSHGPRHLGAEGKLWGCGRVVLSPSLSLANETEETCWVHVDLCANVLAQSPTGSPTSTSPALARPSDSWKDLGVMVNHLPQLSSHEFSLGNKAFGRAGQG